MYKHELDNSVYTHNIYTYYLYDIYLYLYSKDSMIEVAVSRPNLLQEGRVVRLWKGVSI